MKILHLNTFESSGGAAIAARRLHTALNQDGRVTSIMGVKERDSDAQNVYALPLYRSKIMNKVLGKTLAKFNDKLLAWHRPSKNIFFSAYIFPNSLATAIENLHPDIIHLHWIAGNFISPTVLQKISKLSIPTVWTLHDTWAFTGGCHYFGDCHKWQTQCNACPNLGHHFPLDIVKMQWGMKKKSYKKLQPTIIGLSHQFTHDIKKSSLLHEYPIATLPNTIDTKIFRPIKKSITKAILGLSPHKKYILFGACAAANDPRKGYDLLSQALQILSAQNHDSVSCLVFGASHANTPPAHQLPVTFLGELHDEITLALAYSAADVFVCPSREESFSNTTLESLACGTPVVGFAVGGIPDMIEHKVNGMLATPHDPQELAAGIAYVLEDQERREAMGRAARRTVEEKYAYPVVAKQYIELYQQLLNRK
ncbi:glycosyltransferase [uncultured Desulfovibrio sp.]|uniref:glycosyltransferase n=1 Tax=uncultured Desulfovibrio sp. TaxID=167968 RepID=UPI00265EC43A|nr:glycosyltransferase [uncultured Desulfovibrio sp.]